ncbi:hypothetical protein BN1088_1433401 [Sphingobacterium sp. PM2-P1-29]|nr:hypothetical protein BN1088_1433401 [Sphingobacterium sp. PM2-P1-29]
MFLVVGETVYEASLNHKLDVENIYFTAQRLGHDKVLKKG